jgi:hypothetical protein
VADTKYFEEFRRRVAAGEVEAPRIKTPWEKLREKPTLKRAITAKCHECCGWGENDERPPKVRDDIANCTATGCPLYGARPYSRKA